MLRGAGPMAKSFGPWRALARPAAEHRSPSSLQHGAAPVLCQTTFPLTVVSNSLFVHLS